MFCFIICNFHEKKDPLFKLQALDALEKLLRYSVISHEGIRQQVLQTDVVSKDSPLMEK